MGKFLYDLFPIILFYIAYKQLDIYWASGVIILASIFQVLFSYFKHKKVENMHVFSLIIVIILGTATIILRNEMFLKWKITAVNALFGMVFLGSHFFGKKKVIIERMFEGKIELPPKQFSVLNIAWTVFFFAMAALNTYVMFNYDTDTWVNFKLFGVLAITLVFTIMQGVYIALSVKENS